MMNYPLPMRIQTLALLSVPLFAAACGGCPDEFMRACAKKGCAEKVAAALKKDPGLVKVPGAKGLTPLHVAADAAIAEALIAAGADLEVVAGTQQTPLGAAIESDRGAVVRVLLARGSKVFDPLATARGTITSGRASTLEAFLDSGVAPDEGMLLNAVLNDKYAVAELLLKRGVSAKAAMGANMTLLSFGGPPTGNVDVSGKTALELAKSSAMKELLKKHGG